MKIGQKMSNTLNLYSPVHGQSGHSSLVVDLNFGQFLGRHGTTAHIWARPQQGGGSSFKWQTHDELQ